MRRLLLATTIVVVHLAAGCGRSGPLEATAGARTLTVNAPPATAGTISFEIGSGFDAVCPPACGSYGFEDGTAITLEAAGQLGVFESWSGDAASPCGSSSSCTYSPRADQDVGADFVARLVVLSSGGNLGAVTSIPGGIDCPVDCDEDFLFGSTITLTAVPSSSLLQGWGGACAGETGFECDIVLDEYRSAVAWFGRVGVELYGTTGDEWAEAIAADPLVPGGYVVAGSLTQALSLGGMLVPHSSGQDLFVGRFGSDDLATWVETIGGDGDIRPHALAVTAQDGVLACYVGGSFESDAEFDGTNAEDPLGDVNGFVSKHLDEPVPVPTPEWWETVEGNAADNSSHVADLAYRGNRLALTGLHAGQVTVGGQGLSGGNQGNRKHAYDAVFSSSGSLGFAVANGQGGNSHAESTTILFTPVGATVSAGFRDDGVNEGPCTSATNPTDADAWFYQLSGDGSTCTPNNLTSLRPTGENRWSALAAGPSGVFLAVGMTRTLEPSLTVTQYSAGGAAVWTRDFPASVSPGPFAAAYDAGRDRWVLAGSFSGQMDVGGTSYAAPSGRDILVLHLTRDAGTLVAPAIVLGGTGDDVVGGPVIPGTGEFFEMQIGQAASALAILPDGTALVAGWTDSPTLGSPFPASNAGGANGTADIFVLHVLPP